MQPSSCQHSHVVARTPAKTHIMLLGCTAWSQRLPADHCTKPTQAVEASPKVFPNFKYSQNLIKHCAITSVKGCYDVLILNKDKLSQFSQVGWWLAGQCKWKVERPFNALVCPAPVQFWSVWNMSIFIINISTIVFQQLSSGSNFQIITQSNTSMNQNAILLDIQFLDILIILVSASFPSYTS